MWHTYGVGSVPAKTNDGGKKAMILADKIISERKKNGWSQEELAAQMNVTRQAVSKWESAQSTPDLEKILQLSKLFGVSTDYLLKDEMEEEPEYSGTVSEPSNVRRVSMEEASSFLQIKNETSVRIALAVALCILSPICLLLLGGMSEYTALGISENFAVAVGMVVLLLLVAAAAAIFIHCGMKTKPYEYLETEPIETEYGVSGMVKERQARFRDAYARNNILGTCLCILSVVPLFAALLMPENTTYFDLQLVISIALLLVIAAAGVWFFIVAGIRWSSMEKLLEEGEYTKRSKTSNSASMGISTIYWLVVTALYLGYCFITNDWKNSWVVWPVAGVLYAALMVACRLIAEKKKL